VTRHPPARRRSYGDEADLALDLWVALARCGASISRVSARDIQRYGLTQAQFAVLEVLYHKGPMPLCSIGAKLLVTSGNITYVADQLEKTGLLKRQRSEDDRRVTLARLTARGTALLDRCFPQHARRMTEAAASLTPREQQTLSRLLKKWGKAARVG